MLDFLKDKNLPIIFTGNHPIPVEIQEKSDWTLNIKENPTTKYFKKIYYDGEWSWDYGYAHLHQIGKGFLLGKSLGFDYIHHFNYDISIKEDDFNTLVERGKESKPIVYYWCPHSLATQFFSIKTQDYLDSIEENLHFYLNENPPNVGISGIKDNWYCEVFFKWALDYNNISYVETTDIKYIPQV